MIKDLTGTMYAPLNETINVLVSRRSVRSFSQEPVGAEELYQILAAGRYAPSAKNEQPCKFVVIQSASPMNHLVEDTKKMMNREDSPFYSAPTVVVVFAKKDCISPVSDASLALGNMMNAAAALNIGSCWINCVIHYFNDTPGGREFRKSMGLSENDSCVGSIALGYSTEKPEAKPRVEGTVIML